MMYRCSEFPILKAMARDYIYIYIYIVIGRKKTLKKKFKSLRC